MTDQELKETILTQLKAFAQNEVLSQASALFATLGYQSVRQIHLKPATFDTFKTLFAQNAPHFNETKARASEWQTVDLLFQLTKEDVTNRPDLFSTKRVDNTIIESYLFWCIELTEPNYTRTALAKLPAR